MWLEPGSPAAINGKLSVGDRLLAVDDWKCEGQESGSLCVFRVLLSLDSVANVVCRVDKALGTKKRLMFCLQWQAGQDVMRKIIGPAGMLNPRCWPHPHGAVARGSNKEKWIFPFPTYRTLSGHVQALQ